MLQAMREEEVKLSDTESFDIYRPTNTQKTFLSVKGDNDDDDSDSLREDFSMVQPSNDKKPINLADRPQKRRISTRELRQQTKKKKERRRSALSSSDGGMSPSLEIKETRK